MKAAAKAAQVIRTDVTVGELVWFYDRRHGRRTENLARIATVNVDGTCTLVVTDQGSQVMHPKMPEWVNDATAGWVKRKAN